MTRVRVPHLPVRRCLVIAGLLGAVAAAVFGTAGGPSRGAGDPADESIGHGIRRIVQPEAQVAVAGKETPQRRAMANRPLGPPLTHSHAAGPSRLPSSAGSHADEAVAVMASSPIAGSPSGSSLIATGYPSQGPGSVVLCQACETCAVGASEELDPAVDCGVGGMGECRWVDMQPTPLFSPYGPGEYIGPARFPPLDAYRLRAGDVVRFVYWLTREQLFEPYKLNVGDVLLIESVKNAELNREVVVQPDGSITLLMIGPVPAAGRTIEELTAAIREAYAVFYRDDIISITPRVIDTKLRDLLATVDNRAGVGGQRIDVTVTPEGTVQLPAIGSVCVQGLTLDEVSAEVDHRYRSVVHGLGVTPILLERSLPFAYVLGEVAQPQRIVLERPTTVMQAIAMAGGWRTGGNLRQVVVFRRADDWRLMATRIDIRGALLGKRPCPADEIWLRDADVVLIPKTPLRRAGDVIEEVFTNGSNPVILFGSAVGFLTLSSL